MFVHEHNERSWLCQATSLVGRLARVAGVPFAASRGLGMVGKPPAPSPMESEASTAAAPEARPWALARLEAVEVGVDMIDDEADDTAAPAPPPAPPPEDAAEDEVVPMLRWRLLLLPLVASKSKWRDDAEPSFHAFFRCRERRRRRPL